MSSTTGGSSAQHQASIEQIISGGCTLRLMATAVNYQDGQPELDSKEITGTGYTELSVAETSWDITFDNTTRTATLSNNTELDFGTTGDDWGEVVEVVIDADDTTDKYILADEPSDPVLTGEDYSFAAGNIEYTLGDSA